MEPRKFSCGAPPKTGLVTPLWHAWRRAALHGLWYFTIGGVHTPLGAAGHSGRLCWEIGCVQFLVGMAFLGLAMWCLWRQHA